MALRQLTVLATLAASALHAQDRLQPQQLRDDLALLRATLETVHTGLYRYTPKPKMDAAFNDAARKLSRPLTHLEFRVVLSKVIAEIRCGHTGIGEDATLRAFLNTQPLFPFRLAWEDSRLVVIENRSSGQSVKPGAEILEINGRSVGSIYRDLLPFISGDGDILTGRRRSLTRNFSSRYAVPLDRATTFKTRIRDDSGTRTISIQGATLDEMRKNADSNMVNAAIKEGARKIEWASQNVDLRFLRGGQVAQLRVRGFGGGNYPAQLEKSFTEIRDKRASALILDLRGNGGGVDNYGALLVSYLTASPFRYFDHIRIKSIDPPRQHTTFPDAMRDRLKSGTTPNPESGFLILPSLHSALNQQQPARTPFLGKLLVLIDGDCFSTCADVTAVIHHLNRATFIGEETGGAYYGNNSGASITLTLPHSKFPVSIPMWEYWNAVPGYPHARRGTLPDRPVVTRVADVLAGRDASLEAALSESGAK